MNIIDKAADRLRGRWQKGELGDYTGDGDVCPIGALGWAMGSDYESRALGMDRVWTSPELRTLNRVLREESLGRFDAVQSFNDDLSTSEEDVLLLMKKASARLDEATS